MSLSRLKWYIARLSAMSPPEIAHRIREAALKQRWRGNRLGWANFDAIEDATLPTFPVLRQRLAGGADAAVAALDMLDAGKFTGLGVVVASDSPDRWFGDPVSGSLWPSEPYCFDIDVRSTGKGRGDVKFVWEINRLQMLHGLAARIAAERRPADIRRALDILNDWAVKNPPYRGVNWFSGIELAMRLVSITLIVAAIPPDALSRDNRLMLRRLIVAHGVWLHRYPSKYSSANNHLVAEGLGLLLAGLLVPDHAAAAGWVREGLHILEQEAALQIEADGVGGEQSPTYQAFTMEMLGFGVLMAEMTGLSIKAVIRARLAAGARFLRALMNTAGYPPRIGDDDEGRVIATPPDREPRYVASIVGIVAGIMQDASMLPPARDPHLRDALFAVPAGTGSSANGLHAFGHYSILRQSMAGTTTVLTFDHGPLGYLSLAAHGHADSLAVWLSIDDQPVFIDAGTYLYHSGGALRNALRSSSAHNTVTLGGVSQSVPSSAFSWSRKTDAQPASNNPGAMSVAGHHAGYRARSGVTHHRRIDATATGFDISDRLEGGAQPIDAEIGFLVDPALNVQREGEYLLIFKGEQPLLRLIPPAGAEVEILRDDRQTGRGLASSAFGQIEAADQITLRLKLGAMPAITRITLVAG